MRMYPITMIRHPPEKNTVWTLGKTSALMAPYTGVGLWKGTLLCVRVSISTSPAKGEGATVVESVC